MLDYYFYCLDCRKYWSLDFSNLAIYELNISIKEIKYDTF